MERDASESVPPTERVLVGLCHGLNDRIAAVAAYLYLLERRGTAAEVLPALQGQIEQLGHAVRLVRSLARDDTPRPGPVAVTLLAESASELMEAYPEGPVVYTPRAGDESAVVRCDWTRALRALVLVGAWVSRGIPGRVTVQVEVEHGGSATTLVLSAPDELSHAHDGLLSQDGDSHGIRVVAIGPRKAEIRFTRI